MRVEDKLYSLVKKGALVTAGLLLAACNNPLPNNEGTLTTLPTKATKYTVTTPFQANLGVKGLLRFQYDEWITGEGDLSVDITSQAIQKRYAQLVAEARSGMQVFIYIAPSDMDNNNILFTGNLGSKQEKSSRSGWRATISGLDLQPGSNHNFVLTWTDWLPKILTVDGSVREVTAIKYVDPKSFQ